MKTFRLWRIVIVGLVVSLLAATGKAQEGKQDGGAGAASKQKSDDQAKREIKAKAALALASAAAKAEPRGFVNLAPVPRSIPEPMPKAKCPCGESCKCPEGKCPAQCPATAPKTPVFVGYRPQCYTDDFGRQRCTWQPVYEYR